MITQEQEKIFLSYIEKNMHVQLISKKKDIFFFRYIGNNEYDGAATYIASAKYLAKINPEEIQVLVEYPTKPEKRKYAFHGSKQIVKMLFAIYGGFISIDLYWILNNIRNKGNHPFGYNATMSGIFEVDGERIVEQINNMQLNCYVVTFQ